VDKSRRVTIYRVAGDMRAGREIKRAQSVSEAPEVCTGGCGRSFVPQLASFSLATFQFGHLVFSFANCVVPGDKQLRQRPDLWVRANSGISQVPG